MLELQTKITEYRWIIVSIISGAVFLVSQSQLPDNPLFYLSGIEIISLVMFTVGLVGFREWSPAAVFTLILPAALLFVAISSHNPARKDQAAAVEFTGQQHAAAQQGIEAATQQLSEETLDAISSNQDPRLKQIRREAFEAKLEGDLSDEEILDLVVEKIPVVKNEWTCVDAGCSYADDNYVWTLNHADFILAWIVEAGIIFVATAITISYKNKDGRSTS